MTATSRRWLPVVAGLAAAIAAFLALMPWGCVDVDGVPSWERCTSALGTPAFSVEDWGFDSSLNILVPVVALLVVGFVAWLFGTATNSDGAGSDVG